MKLCKKLMLLLLVLVMTFALTTEVLAAGNQVEVKSGSKEATVTFTIEDVLAFEGTVNTVETVGFFDNVEITPKVPNDWIKITKGNKVVCVGGSTPEDITLTVKLTSDSAMRNGIYSVTMDYTATYNTNGYAWSGRMYSVIYAGVEIPDEEDLKNESSSTKKPTKQEDTKPEVEVTTPEDDPNRVDVMGMLDLSALRSALEEAEKLRDSGRLDSAELKKLQAAIDAGEEAMKGDRQAVVDDATVNLWAVIEELGGPVTDEEPTKPDRDKSGGSKLLLPLILALIAVLAVAGLLVYRHLKKKRRADYEGAPIVDYEIGDDDVV